jgi:hypothetical protein
VALPFWNPLQRAVWDRSEAYRWNAGAPGGASRIRELRAIQYLLAARQRRIPGDIAANESHNDTLVSNLECETSLR